MPEPIVFKYGRSNLFRWAKCINVRKGDYWDVPAAPDAEPIPGSDTLVVCPDILLVLAGAFEMQVPELTSPIQLPAGEAGSPQRFRSALRVVATADDSSYVCFIPRDQSFWQREVGFVAAGDRINLDVPAAAEAHLFVPTGGLTGAGAEVQANTVRALSTGQTTTFTAAHDTWFILVWR